MLEVSAISFSYPHRRVLESVSFSAGRGEVVAVTGRNGAGKTTLLRVLSLLAVPASGSVRLDGQCAFSRPLRYLRQTGYLPEKPALYEDMTVKGYLKYRAALKGELSKRVRRRLGESIELARLQREADTPIGMLSAGLKKRVALADAFLLRPRLLLLDDLLAGLDGEMRASAGEIIADAAAFSAVVVTGHEIGELAGFADRFLVLENGVVTADVPVEGSDRGRAAADVAEALAGKGAR